jgi:hypothetical protein
MVSDFDFLNNIWPQNCGDTLKILGKSDYRQGRVILWEVEFQKYPYKTFARKQNILKGIILNPRIEEEEFIGQIFPQKCNDNLKVIKKSDIKYREIFLYECEFQKYPYKVFARKSHILEGTVDNPQIEQVEFVDKIWHQNCGDDLKIICKSNIKSRENYLFEAEFLKYPCKIFVSKCRVIKGGILNPKMPWLNKQNLIKYIQENFQEKPTLQELANSLNISYSYLRQKAKSFDLKNFINYSYKEQENKIKEFVSFVYKGPIETFNGKKEDNYYEIDIYLPELKKGIEYNGSVYHEEGNPNNKFSKPIGYHQKKKEFFAKKGIDILFIWDYEWFEDFPKRNIINEQTKQKIEDFILN